MDIEIIKSLLLLVLFVLFPVFWFHIYFYNRNKELSFHFVTLTAIVSLLLNVSFSVHYIEHIYDFRLLPVLFSFLYGGFFSGLTVTAVFIGYRLLLGGPGVLSAIVAIIPFIIAAMVLSQKYKTFTFRKRVATFSLMLLFYCVTLIDVIYWLYPHKFFGNLTFYLLIFPVMYQVNGLLFVFLFEKAVRDKEAVRTLLQFEKQNAISQLASSLVHEVRNPLTAIKGFITLLTQTKLPPEKVQQYYGIIMEEVTRTEHILSDYLSIGKTNSGTVHTTTIGVGKILYSVCQVLTPYAINHNVKLQCENLAEQQLYVNADGEKLKQAFMNIIKNAIEACSESEGLVHIQLGLQNLYAVATITDNGPGLSEDQLKKIGNLYYSTKGKGTGLGLVTTYEIIKSFNGKVSVSSQLNQGTAFTIMLPCVSSNAG